MAKGGQAAGRAREQGGRTEASQTAEFAASGVDVRSGSVQDVVGSTAAVSELDAQILKNDAARQAFGYTTQGKQFRRQARYTRQAGQAAADADILGGAVGAAGAARGMLSVGPGGGPNAPSGGGSYSDYAAISD